MLEDDRWILLSFRFLCQVDPGSSTDPVTQLVSLKFMEIAFQAVVRVQLCVREVVQSPTGLSNPHVGLILRVLEAETTLWALRSRAEARHLQPFFFFEGGAAHDRTPSQLQSFSVLKSPCFCFLLAFAINMYL